MKLAAGIMILLTSVISFAQADCSLNRIEFEANQFIKLEAHGELSVLCLNEAIKNETGPKGLRVRKVLDRIKAIKQQDAISATVKCEASGAPDCDDNEASILERDADLKNEAVKRERADGTRDW